jgi:hypothetical protein
VSRKLLFDPGRAFCQSISTEGSMGVLSGKVAIVTGSARGIGREIAMLFGHEGEEVVVNDLVAHRPTGTR